MWIFPPFSADRIHPSCQGRAHSAKTCTFGLYSSITEELNLIYEFIIGSETSGMPTLVHKDSFANATAWNSQEPEAWFTSGIATRFCVREIFALLGHRISYDLYSCPSKMSNFQVVHWFSVSCTLLSKALKLGTILCFLQIFAFKNPFFSDLGPQKAQKS